MGKIVCEEMWIFEKHHAERVMSSVFRCNFDKFVNY